MNPPDFSTFFAIADCGGRLVAELQSKYGNCLSKLESKCRTIEMRSAVEALRYVARNDLSLVGARVAVWRGKDGAYRKALSERLRAFRNPYKPSP